MRRSRFRDWSEHESLSVLCPIGLSFRLDFYRFVNSKRIEPLDETFVQGLISSSEIMAKYYNGG